MLRMAAPLFRTVLSRQLTNALLNFIFFLDDIDVENLIYHEISLYTRADKSSGDDMMETFAATGWDKLKHEKIFSLSVLILLLLVASAVKVSAVNTTWSSEIQVGKTYHWHVEKTNFRGSETFNESNLAGSDSIDGGDIAITIEDVHQANVTGETSQPELVGNQEIDGIISANQNSGELPSDFDFISGDRLELSVVIEGDMVKEVNNEQERYHSDWHLFILPISVDGQNFFEILFAHEDLLSNMTQGEFIGSEITESQASARFKLDEHLNVTYIWDVTSGLLKEKRIESDDGGMLKILPGEGKVFEAAPTNVPGFLLVTVLATMILGMLVIKKNHVKKR